MKTKRGTTNSSQTANTGKFFSLPRGALTPVLEGETNFRHGDLCILLKKAKRYTSALSKTSNADEQKKKFDDAEQSVAKFSGRKKKVWSIVFFIINLAVLAAILLKEFIGTGFQPLVVKNWSALFIVLALFVAEYFFEAASFGYLIKKSTGKTHILLAFKTNAIGRYYDAITPLGTGGQPFQITYLKGRDLPMHSALAIPLAKYVFAQISWILISLVCMIVSFSVSGYNSLMSWVSVVGWILGSAVLIATIFLSISKSTGRKILIGVLRLLQKMKIVKNFERTYQKISKHIEEFQGVMQHYAKSPKDFIILFGIMLLKSLFYYSMPFFIYCMLIGYDWDLYILFFVTTVMIGLAASFFPLPGGTGMSELSFSAFFGSYFAGGNLFWALLLWRFLTYYIHLLIGISIITYDFSYGNRKFRWQKRKSELVQESAIFKQEQIDRFRAERNRRRRSATHKF